MQCRACLKTNCSTLINMAVANTDEGHTLFDLFNDCTQLHASVIDNLPKTLCKTCTSNLRIAYSFRKCALESNDMLVKVLTLQKANTQSTVNSIMNNGDYTEDPLKIAFGEALKAVEQLDREEHLFVEESGNKLSSFEYEYGYDSALINETTVVEQSATSCHSDNNQSQENITEDAYNENSFIGFEESEIHTVEYVERDSQEHIKRKYEEENKNINTTSCYIPYDDQMQIKKYIKSERNNLNNDIEKTDRIEIEIATSKLRCLYCTGIYSSDFELQDHVKRHLFKCPFCSNIFTAVGRYYRHIKRLHHRSKIDVPASQAVMEGVEINEDKRIYCKTCKVAYSNIFTYKRHLPKKHDSEDVHETISYVEKENLQEQIYNSNLKDFLCSFCPCVLSSKHGLKNHEEKQHLNIEPDMKTCSFCQKKFDKAYLGKHIEIVHIGERKYKCDICGNMYKTNKYLMRHRLLHTKNRNFPCTVCDKRFAEKSELKVHMRLHTGENPFACHLCDRSFRIKVHLTYHMQQHALIKHKCNVCGKEFKHGKSLRNHFYIHTNVMPYRCSVCGYGSEKRDYFVNHMLHEHDKTMSVDELFTIFQANSGRSPYVKIVDDIDTNDEHTEDMETAN